MWKGNGLQEKEGGRRPGNLRLQCWTLEQEHHVQIADAAAGVCDCQTAELQARHCILIYATCQEGSVAYGSPAGRPTDHFQVAGLLPGKQLLPLGAHLFCLPGFSFNPLLLLSSKSLGILELE